MEMMQVLLMLLFCILFLVASASELMEEIKEIRKIKIKPDDDIIEAKVVNFRWAVVSTDIHPILQYNVDGTDKRYTYHFYYSSKGYPIGKQMTLKLSKESGLAYDKADLIKAVL